VKTKLHFIIRSEILKLRIQELGFKTRGLIRENQGNTTLHFGVKTSVSSTKYRLSLIILGGQ